MRKPFVFKEFKINQENAAMPVTTDACIFGALIHLETEGAVLDIGCGTGLLTLMLAQRYPHKQYTAVELQVESAATAEQNFANSPWRANITAIQGNILDFRSENRFGTIVCNPPFFENQLPSLAEGKRLARHAGELNYTTLLGAIHPLLDDSGFCWLLVPALHGGACIQIAESLGFYLKRRIAIQASASKPAHLFVLAFGKNPTVLIEQGLVVYEQQGVYSREMQLLMQDYYL